MALAPEGHRSARPPTSSHRPSARRVSTVDQLHFEGPSSAMTAGWRRADSARGIPAANRASFFISRDHALAQYADAHRISAGRSSDATQRRRRWPSVFSSSYFEERGPVFGRPRRARISERGPLANRARTPHSLETASAADADVAEVGPDRHRPPPHGRWRAATSSKPLRGPGRTRTLKPARRRHRPDREHGRGGIFDTAAELRPAPPPFFYPRWVRVRSRCVLWGEAVFGG